MNVSESIPAIQAARISRSTWSRFKRRVLILGAGQQATDTCQSILIIAPVVSPRIIGTHDYMFESVEKDFVQTIAVCLEDGRSLMPV